jgi:hypothetical protein
MSFSRVDDLLGAWRLESAVEVFDDGERRDEFGPNPEGYLCYNPAGPFSVDVGNRTVTHHVNVSLFPNWQGHHQVRRVTIEAGRLCIMASDRTSADGQMELRGWRRNPEPLARPRCWAAVQLVRAVPRAVRRRRRFR